MKNKITALVLVAVTAFALAPKPAKAGDKELAVVGGLIGGLIIGSAIADSHHSSDYRSTVVVDGYRDGRYDNRYDHRYDNRYDGRHRGRYDRHDRGFWKEVRVKIWVPARWVIEHSLHGRDYRRYVEGYYTYRTDRVWVSYDRHDRRGDGRW